MGVKPHLKVLLIVGGNLLGQSDPVDMTDIAASILPVCLIQGFVLFFQYKS